MYIYHYTLRTRELGNTQSTDVSSSIVDASHSEQEQLKQPWKFYTKAWYGSTKGKQDVARPILFV